METQAFVTPFDRGHFLGIYVHVPWCIQKCRYCDFYSVSLNSDGTFAIPTEKLDIYLQTLSAEFFYRLRLQRRFCRFAGLQTIFFGGGTASLLPAWAIAKLLHLFRSQFDFTPDCEITVEGNPENLTPEYLAALRDCGVTRVSAGIQTFRRDLLEKMGRYFHPESYAALLENLAAAGLKSYSIDLIYGFPGQKESDFFYDLDRLLSANIPHLSLYSLTAEQGTPYGSAVQNAQEQPPDEGLQDHIFQLLPDRLMASGLKQYEISNYAQLEDRCRHNLRYWLYEACLALGPGAHGFDGRQRYANRRNIFHWQKDPVGAPLQEQSPHLDVPLSLLRLCLPMPLTLWKSVLTEDCGLEQAHYERALACLQHWVDKGLGRWLSQPEKSFVWQKIGLQYLDDRILEMCCFLEKGDSDLPVAFI